MTDENVVSPRQNHFPDWIYPDDFDDFGYDDEPDYVDEDTYRLLQEMKITE